MINCTEKKKKRTIVINTRRVIIIIFINVFNRNVNNNCIFGFSVKHTVVKHKLTIIIGATINIIINRRVQLYFELFFVFPIHY